VFFQFGSHTKGVTRKRDKRREARAEKKEMSVGSSTRRRQDKRRKGFKPRTRDKLACPAGGRFLEVGHTRRNCGW